MWGWRLCRPRVTVGPEQCQCIHPQQPVELTGAGCMQQTPQQPLLHCIFTLCEENLVPVLCIIHSRLIGVQWKLQWVNQGGMPLLCPLSTYCQVLLCLHVCVCVCVFFQSLSIPGGGREGGREAAALQKGFFICEVYKIPSVLLN